MLGPALVLAAVLAQSSATPTPAVVLGRVVDAATSRPIPGAIVYVGGSALPPQRGVPPRVMTNGDGQFVVRGLRKGTLYLNVTREGYLDATLGQRRPMGSAQPLGVDEGRRYTDVQVRMWRPAVIAGSVVDEAGEPAVGARIYAYRRILVAGRPRYQPAIDWITDDRGQYRLAGLVPGDYTVAAVSPHDGDAMPPIARADGVLLVYPTIFYPASRTAAEAAVVSVRSGEERSGVDLQRVLVPTVSVSGFVIGPDGAAAHTPVRLMPGGPESLANPSPAAEATTDEAGAFTLPSVPSGEYTLSVMRLPDEPSPDVVSKISVIQAAGTTITTIGAASPPGAPPAVSPDATLCADVPLNVGDRNLTDVVVSLRPGPRVSGRVEFSGATEPPTQQQIQNMRIALERADGTQLLSRLSFETGHPDENGRFITAGVPPGRYLLRVTNTVQGWFFLGAIASGRDLADEPIDLRKDVNDVVLTFTDRPPVLGGVVRDGSKGDGDAYVIAFPVDSSAWVNQGISQRRLRTTRPAKDGSYTMPPLPPGDYYVAAVKEDSGLDPYDPALLEALAAQAKQVRLVEGERRTLDLQSLAIQ